MDSNRQYLVSFGLALATALGISVTALPLFAQQTGSDASATSVAAAEIPDKTTTDLTAEQLYALAASFYANQDWQSASEHFQILIDQHPDHEIAANAAFYLGETLVQLNRHEEAEQIFEDFIREQTGNIFAARAQFRLAECKYLNSDFETSKKMFLEFFETNRSDPLAEFALPYLGELHLRFGDAELSKNAYQEALERFPGSGLSDKCRLGLAQALHRLNEDTEAIRFYRFLANQPANQFSDDARLLLGKLYAERGDWDEARKEFDLIVRKHPNSELRTEAEYLIAKSDMTRGDWASSWKNIEPLLEKTSSDKQFIRIGLDAAIIAIRVAEIDRARSLVERIKKLKPTGNDLEITSVLEIDIANRMKELETLQELVARFEKKFSNSPHITRCVEPLARMHYDRGQFAEAANRYQQLVDLVTMRPNLVGNLPAWRYLLGLSRIGTGEYEIASGQLEQIKDFGANPHFEAATSFAIATALAGQKKYTESIPHYERYLGLLPTGDDSVRCSADLAIALAKTSQLDRGVVALEKVLSANANDIAVLGACEIVAELALQANDKSTAKRFFEILAKSDQPKFASRGANGMMWSGDETMLAADNLDSVIKTGIDPNLAMEAIIGQVQQLQAQNKHQQTIDILQKVVKAHAGSDFIDEAKFRLAVSLQRIGGDINSRTAVTLLEEFVANKPDDLLSDLARYELAWARHDSSNISGALETFEEIADHHPDSDYRVDACYRAAMLRKQIGSESQTGQRLRQIVEWEPGHNLASYAHYTLGEMASNDEQWSDAIDHFEIVIRTATEDSLINPARYWLAESLYQGGQVDKAETSFESLKGIRFPEPEINSVIWLRLAQCAARRADWETVDAIVQQRQTAEDNTTQKFQLDYLQGRVHMSRARFQEARQMFKFVLRNQDAAGTQTAAMSQWMIGESWFHQEEYKHALRAYLLVDSLYGYEEWRSLALLQASKCHVKLNDRANAISTCERMIGTFPDSSHADQARSLLAELGIDQSAGDRATETTKPKTLPANWSK